jgi:hypothetical protein
MRHRADRRAQERSQALPWRCPSCGGWRDPEETGCPCVYEPQDEEEA